MDRKPIAEAGASTIKHDRPETELTEMELKTRAAMDAIAQECLNLPMHPNGAAISAYINSVLNNARMDALYRAVQKLVPKEDLDQELLFSFQQCLTSMQKQRAHVIDNAPRIVRANH